MTILTVKSKLPDVQATETRRTIPNIQTNETNQMLTHSLMATQIHPSLAARTAN